ncbi:MAG: undecaprenyl/decaprenyl-phosphate alpha-N-acetylglucosaminyl 1-phosphate transferase [Candidatus Omnitrophica bacterium]|nr:undecaprenyl/decaprenyl-phosphate alpha-N-acetylglucosaminyl 1-phosphate transferase [Candidatus Omnitrophota bacterium]
MQNFNLAIIFLSAFLSSLIILSLLKKISSVLPLFRSKEEVTYLGGVGLFLSTIGVFLLYSLSLRVTLPFQLNNIFIFSFAILIVELLDDWREFSFQKKLLIQMIIILLYLLNGKKVQIYFLPHWINWVISFLWIVGITNAFNLLDIGDGLASGVGLIISFFLCLISLLCGDYLTFVFFLILTGALSSFYLFNFPPAKMYMGNSGSHLLGFLFATLTIYLDYATLKNASAIFVPLIILAFPVIDTFFTIFTRIKKGLSPFQKSEDHIFLRLIHSNFGYRKALTLIYFVVVVWSLSAIFLLKRSILFGGSIGFSILITFFVIFRALSKTTNLLGSKS